MKTRIEIRLFQSIELRFPNTIILDDDRHDRNSGEHTGSPRHRVIHWFKTMTTNKYIRGVKQSGWTPFPGKLWQRNYYEHIVRNENELIRIREYIRNNPAKWDTDKDNPHI